MPPKKPSNSVYHDNAVLHEICSRMCGRIDELFDHLSIDLRRSGRRYIGKCPVHGGRSPIGLNFYPDGTEVQGYWECLSNGCHKIFPRSAIGFVRGVLSHDKYDWEKPGDRQVSHRDAVDTICDFLGVKIKDIQVDRGLLARQRLAGEVEFMGRKLAVTPELCSKQQFHAMTEIPASYYLDRGYQEATLREFEVGLVVTPKSKEYGRIVYPVYDPEFRMIIGAVSRSTQEKCDSCGLCHDEPPCPQDRMSHLRWKVVGDFMDKLHLYNLWRAKPYITSTKTIVLVEGAGDVWRAHEAGIKNVVALFGSSISDTQTVALECMGLRKIILGFDEDDAGRNASFQIGDHLSHIAKIIDVIPHGDFGSMKADELKTLLGGVM